MNRTRTSQLHRLVVLVFAVVVACAVPAMAAATAGRARIVKPDQTTALNSGGSQTLYSLALPSGAHCAGDSAHRGYHVFSYLVPKGTDPASVNFKHAVPDRGFGLVYHGEFYAAINTAENTGQIIQIPNDFVWSRLTPADLFPAGATATTWEGGLACADSTGAMTQYWNVEVAFTKSASDPGGFTWVVTQPGSSGGGHGRRVVWVGALAAVAGGLWLAVTRRSTISRSTSTS